MSSLHEFLFIWKEGGLARSTKVAARTYTEACWRLGLIQGRRFIVDGIPKDFKIKIIFADAPAAKLLTGDAEGIPAPNTSQRDDVARVARSLIKAARALEKAWNLANGAYEIRMAAMAVDEAIEALSRATMSP